MVLTELIKISRNTKNTLDNIGKKTETYNDIIERILEKNKVNL